jgi:hypothetical protein
MIIGRLATFPSPQASNGSVTIVGWTPSGSTYNSVRLRCSEQVADRR